MITRLKNAAFSNCCGEIASYGFYGRNGGVSEGIYKSLNCGPGSGDVPEAVTENKRRVAVDLNVSDGQISTLSQCHSDRCLIIEQHVAEGDLRPKADALVTDVPGLAFGALSADCGPVLMIGKKQNGAPVIGAAHAGWGGALGGVLESTVDKMLQVGATFESIRACLGPCLGPKSFEVSQGFERPFIIRHEESEKFFTPARREGHLMFDMPGYIAMRLAVAGLREIYLTDVDTYKNEADYFSYRRATHRAEPDYGRQISAIVINR